VAVVVIAGAVALVAPHVSWPGPPRPAPPASAEPTCDGVESTSGAGFALVPHTVTLYADDGVTPASSAVECAGWIIERDLPFGSTDAAVNAVISKIVAENQRVAKPDGQAPPTPYVRIGVLMSMTSSTTGALAPTEILHALQGAYTAQWQANHGDEFLDKTPQIQLVLANEATDKSAWSTVVKGLGTLRAGDHPLVAVTGLGISVPETRAAAEALGKLGIPTVGAVITADDMIAPSMFKVSPSNHQYAEALKDYLDTLRAARSNRTPVGAGYLIWDRNAKDNFVTQLKAAFMDTFDAQYDLKDHNRAFTGSKKPHTGTAQLFGEIKRDICATTTPPDIVFYAGRDRDLAGLVNALKDRGSCQNPKKKLVIVTGATGLTISPAELDAADVGLLDASCTDAATWIADKNAAPAHFDRFRQTFVAAAPAGLGFPVTDLNDGYAILHHDAVAAVAWAVRLDASAKDSGDASAAPVQLGPADTRNAMFGNVTASIPGASGDIFFRELPANNLWPANKPVPIIRMGAVVAGWPAAVPYKTP
jgi:hypothetical protein